MCDGSTGDFDTLDDLVPGLGTATDIEASDVTSQPSSGTSFWGSIGSALTGVLPAAIGFGTQYGQLALNNSAAQDSAKLQAQLLANQEASSSATLDAILPWLLIAGACFAGYYLLKKV